VVWAAVDDTAGVGVLGTRLRLLARRRGCAGQWRAFAAGVLGVPVAAVDALAAEPLPATPEEDAAVALRHGVDAWILRRMLELASRRSAPDR